MRRQTLFRFVNLIVGAALLVGLLWLALRSSGSIYYYLDLPSLSFVAGFVLATMWLGHGPINTAVAVFEGLAARAGLDQEKRIACAQMLSTGHRLAWVAGVLGFLVGVIILLQNMDDPSKTGPGMAIALHPMFYGAVLAECVFAALHTRLMQAGEPATPAGDGQSATGGTPVNRSIVMHSMLVVMIGFTMFLLLMTSMSEVKQKPKQGPATGSAQNTHEPSGNAPATEAEIREALREWLQKQ